VKSLGGEPCTYMYAAYYETKAFPSLARSDPVATGEHGRAEQSRAELSSDAQSRRAEKSGAPYE
jgi:hypothetical protein